MPTSTVFISYATGSAAGNDWAAMLARAIEALPEYHVRFDQFDLHPGKDLTHFMDVGLASDKIVVIVTPAYVRKAQERAGGVGYESSVISAELLANALSSRVVPVLREGEQLPSFLRSKVYVDFRDDGRFDEAFGALLRALREEPPLPRPPKLSAVDATAAPGRVLPSPTDSGASATFRVSDPADTHLWTSYTAGVDRGSVVTYLFSFLNESASVVRNLSAHIALSYSERAVIATGTLHSHTLPSRRGTARVDLVPDAGPVTFQLTHARLYAHDQYGVSLNGHRVLHEGTLLGDLLPGDGLHAAFAFLVVADTRPA